MALLVLQESFERLGRVILWVVLDGMKGRGWFLLVFGPATFVLILAWVSDGKGFRDYGGGEVVDAVRERNGS